MAVGGLIVIVCVIAMVLIVVLGHVLGEAMR